jgi:hypothetical protein
VKDLGQAPRHPGTQAPRHSGTQAPRRRWPAAQLHQLVGGGEGRWAALGMPCLQGQRGFGGQAGGFRWLADGFGWCPRGGRQLPPL